MSENWKSCFVLRMVLALRLLAYTITIYKGINQRLSSVSKPTISVQKMQEIVGLETVLPHLRCGKVKYLIKCRGLFPKQPW